MSSFRNEFHSFRTILFQDNTRLSFGARAAGVHYRLLCVWTLVPKKRRKKEKERARKRRGLVVLGSGDEDPGVLVRDADQEPEREEEKTPCGLYRDKLWREQLQNGATILARHGDYQLHKLI
ncbi:hypothetical protein TNCV_1455251 [Trichonephila clavipes]|nr:hypothetical protein TNCV_1455251 [Trichonephila clavipes]